MAESCKRVVEWPDVDETTFLRFFQFAYTGQFDAEEPEKPPPQTPEPLKDHDPVPPGPRPNLIWNLNMKNSGAAFPPMNKQGQKKADLWASFKQAYEPLEDSSARWPLPDQDPTSDFTRVFLAYARLYVLADEKDVQGLAELSLRRLHHTLVHFNIQGQRADSIASLVDYCFENTCDKGGEQDKMRHLICLFTACNFEVLWTSTEFQRVFTGLREFSIGVLGLMLSRLD
ncbi:hypothetical protein PG995_006914 [Apiospora arundinis]